MFICYLGNDRDQSFFIRALGSIVEQSDKNLRKMALVCNKRGRNGAINKDREFELFMSYRAERPGFPDTWHFKRLSGDFAKEPVNDFIAGMFTKNSFSRHEVEIIESAASYHNDGFLKSVLDQIYYFCEIFILLKNYSLSFTIWLAAPAVIAVAIAGG